MIRLTIAGAMGRMGRCVMDLAVRDHRFEMVAALTASNCSAKGQTLSINGKNIPVTDQLTSPADVLIDFTSAGGTTVWLEQCVERRLPMVIGSTGHSPEDVERIRSAATTIPIVIASNFAIGVQVILRLLKQITQSLGDEYDVEIVEAHHRGKIDAPSGTALRLADEILDARSGTHNENLTFGRVGAAAKRKPGEIGIHAVRMGDVVSSHEIHFSGPGETVMLRHTAHSRDTFAAGALRAAAWVIGQNPNCYDMWNVLNLERKA